MQNIVKIKLIIQFFTSVYTKNYNPCPYEAVLYFYTVNLYRHLLVWVSAALRVFPLHLKKTRCSNARSTNYL